MGPTLKLNLIRFFGGVDKVMDASIEELETFGIGKAVDIYIAISEEHDFANLLSISEFFINLIIFFENNFMFFFTLRL